MVANGRMNCFTDRATAQEQSDFLLVEQILAARKRLGRSIVVGLSGAQGSGKSSTARRIVSRLQAGGCRAMVLSIDDFYLTRAERADLARHVHPLLMTRGVPGTHDVALVARTIRQMLAASQGDGVAAPVFDKTTDDRVPPDEWPIYRGQIDVVLLEGWCVGARPQDEAALREPVNDLEREEDPGGEWRRYVNSQLGGAYRALFGMLDLRIFLRAPDFEQVYAWRAEQEAGLQRIASRSLPAMDERALHRFIAHYERITRWMLADEPADVILRIAADRVPLGWHLTFS